MTDARTRAITRRLTFPLTSALGSSPWGAAASPYDADAALLFAAMDSSPSTYLKSAVNTFILALKAIPCWDTLDHLQVPVFNTDHDSMLEWKSKTVKGTLLGAPVRCFQRGYFYDGVDDFMRWGVTPAAPGGSNFQRNSGMIAAFIRRSAQIANASVGVETTQDCLLRPRTASDSPTGRVNQTSASDQVAGGNTDGYGLMAHQRTGASATEMFYKGASLGAFTTASTALSTNPFCSGKNAGVFAQNQIGLHLIGAPLTTLQHAALNTAVQAFMDAIGAWTTVTSTVARDSTSSVNLPDGASGSAAGHGFTGTGLSRAPDGTWWVGNHGKALPASPSYAASLVHLSADFTTILGEITTTALSVLSGSFQGVAYDTSDGTLWAVLKDPGVSSHVIHCTTAGVLLSDTTLGDATGNSISYDSYRDQLVINTDTAIKWYAKSDLTTALRTFTLSSAADQLSYNAEMDHVTVSRDGNSVIHFDPPGINNTTPLAIRTYTMNGIDKIEGNYLDKVTGTRWVLEDAYYHSGVSGLNRVLIYPGP